MTPTLVIEAQAVQVGDRIYHAQCYAPDKWVRVTRTLRSGEYTALECGGLVRWLHPREGIAVQRSEA